MSGFIATLMMFPDQDLVIASLSNLAEINTLINAVHFYVVETLLDIKSNVDWIEGFALPRVTALYESKAQAVQGSLPPQIPNKPATFAHNLKAYVGSYSDPLWGTWVIGVDKQKNATTGKEEEVLTYKLNEFGSVLEHYHYDAFVATINDVLLQTRMLMTFTIRSNRVVTLHIQDPFAVVGMSNTTFKKL